MNSHLVLLSDDLASHRGPDGESTANFSFRLPMMASTRSFVRPVGNSSVSNFCVFFSWTFQISNDSRTSRNFRHFVRLSCLKFFLDDDLVSCDELLDSDYWALPDWWIDQLIFVSFSNSNDRCTPNNDLYKNYSHVSFNAVASMSISQRNSYTVGFKDRDILELAPLPVTRGSISLLIILVSLTWNLCHFNPETSPGDLAGRALDLGRTNNASAPDPEA